MLKHDHNTMMRYKNRTEKKSLEKKKNKEYSHNLNFS